MKGDMVMNHLSKGLCVLCFIFFIGCAAKTGVLEDAAEANSPLMISKVDLAADGKGSVLTIHSTKEPKYNVFKLMDPERVVVDLIDAKLEEGVPTSIAGNDLIKEVKVQALEDSLSALVRMEIVLQSGANYLAEPQSDGLVLRLLKLSEPENSEKVEPTAPLAALAPVEAEKPAEVQPDAAMSAEAPALVPALPLPVPEVAVTPEIKPEPKVEAKTAEQAPAEPVVEPSAPKLEPETLPKAESSAELKSLDEKSEASKTNEVVAAPSEGATDFPTPVVVPVPTGKDKQHSSGKKSVKKADNSLKPVADQEIPSVLTNGTSLLTELDSKVYTGRRVSLEFQDADVQDILKLIADVSKLNIVTGDDVKGKLTLKLIDVPWDQALDIILTTLGLDKTQHGNIIRVAPSEKLRKEREVALANDKAAKQLEPLRLKLINVNYAKAEELSSRIKNLLSDRGTVDTDTRTNTLIVKDIREHLVRVENLVKALDTQTPQVRIEARIVQANDQFTKNLGIQWGPTLHLDSTNTKERSWQFPHSIAAGAADGTMTLPGYAVDALPGSANAGTLGFRLGSISSIFNLDLKLQYLEQESLGRVVSRPSISVLDNRTARIIQGSKVPFLSASSAGTSVSFQEVGVQISVTPQITSDGAVILKVQTSSNEILDTSVGGNPITTLREASTEMLVKSGRTAVLGGVFKSGDTSSKAGVPGLYNLPVIGWLFGNSSSKSSREETLVFVTPYILNDARLATATPSSESSIEH